MSYRCVTTLSEIQNYLGDSGLISFDYETSPDEAFRDTPKAALDPLDTDDLYFAANKDGVYAYAETFEQHQKNLADLGI